MPNRAERRRQARAQAKQNQSKQPIIIVSDNIVAAELGQQYEATAHGRLPDKVPGQHRWIVAACWSAPNALVATAHDPSVMKLLDNENLFTFSIGCWDCEEPYGKILPDSTCPATGDG